MNVEEEIAYIQSRLDQSELLCQLAEEASELAQAALKLRRALDGTNPTPKSKARCMADLYEEIADTNLCLNLLKGIDINTLHDIGECKLHRWVERLREKKGENIL